MAHNCGRNSLLLLLICSALPLFAHDAEIKMEGENRYKSIRLTPQIYNAANSNLSDILIKDSKGENVPYFINSNSQKTQSNRETYPLMQINSYVKDDFFYFDYKLVAIRNSDTIATSIEFLTRNTDFAKAVNIYGSYDNINWEFVQSDTLYSVDDKTKLTIDFARPQKNTHYRLRLSNNLERISFYKSDLVYSIETVEETHFIESLMPEFSIENEDKKTNIIIEGLKNLRLCDFTVHTDTMFIRTISAPRGIKKEIYNLSINDTSCLDTTVPLNRHISTGDTYTVTITDADDKPLNITGLTVRYYADDIVFEGSTDKVYTLEFGANPEKKAPVYDIERYKNEILKGEIDRLTIGELRFSAVEKPKTFPVKIIFNIVIIAISLLLGAVIILRLKK
ncbi:MAG: Ig-like domain-containing protein [Treponema sp.]|jgi:hypothetical protein|nr:Ig-like domain-containing protein [Treponema sp.]